MNAVILAGSRGGVDPVAAYAGVAHKALIELGRETMLARVARALEEAGCAPVVVSTGDAAVAAEAERLGCRVLPSAPGPSASVADALGMLGAPLLVTTADHALLEGGWVRRFVADTPADADIAVLLARREVVEAALPGTRRTWLRFADEDWSGCNLFLLASPRAAGAIDLWRLVEADRKRPWRIVRRFGLRTLFAYLRGRLTLARAVERLGELAGVRAAAVTSPAGLAAIDVDKPADLDAVRGVLAARG